jgi:hypothetical protein
MNFGNNQMNFGALNLSGVTPDDGLAYMTAGYHEAEIVEATFEKNSKGTGAFVKVMFRNDDGEVTFDQINVFNASPQAEEIGRKRLKAMLIAANHPNPDNPTDVKTMVGLRLGLHVEEGSPYRDKNGVEREGRPRPRKNAAYENLGVVGDLPTGVPQTPVSNGIDPDDEIPFV